jgi:hypothetical protein
MTDEELKGLFETMQRETRGTIELAQREMRGELVGMRGELATMDTRIGSVRDEMGAMGKTLREEMVVMATNLREEIVAQHDETRRLFDVTIERMDERHDLIGEGLVALDEKFERRCNAIEEQLRATKSETQAMIRAALGRRVK